MCLDLAHRRNMSLRDLMVILHIILQRLVVVVLHFFTRHAPDFRKLVSLVIRFGHRDLILRVEG